MIKKLGTFINNIVRSLDNTQNSGYSARKLTALFAIIMAAYVTKYHLPETDQLYALCAWLGIALLCLGIVTVEQIIKFKTGNSTENKNP